MELLRYLSRINGPGGTLTERAGEALPFLPYLHRSLFCKMSTCGMVNLVCIVSYNSFKSPNELTHHCPMPNVRIHDPFPSLEFLFLPFPSLCFMSKAH